MSLAKITQVKALALAVPGDDIDTDRIIPARFLRCVTFDGLGEHAFRDERTGPDGKERAHPMNSAQAVRIAAAKQGVMVVGFNFGCGSSREHAPQALYRHGFRAVLAESYAEIFFGNAITLGMPCLVMDGRDIRALAALIEEAPQTEINLDLPNGQVSMADVSFPAKLPDHAKEALVDGKWDAIADLLEGLDAVQATAAKLPYIQTA